MDEVETVTLDGGDRGHRVSGQSEATAGEGGLGLAPCPPVPLT